MNNKIAPTAIAPPVATVPTACWIAWGLKAGWGFKAGDPWLIVGVLPGFIVIVRLPSQSPFLSLKIIWKLAYPNREKLKLTVPSTTEPCNLLVKVAVTVLKSILRLLLMEEILFFDKFIFVPDWLITLLFFTLIVPEFFPNKIDVLHEADNFAVIWDFLHEWQLFLLI